MELLTDITDTTDITPRRRARSFDASDFFSHDLLSLPPSRPLMVDGMILTGTRGWTGLAGRVPPWVPGVRV